MAFDASVLEAASRPSDLTAAYLLPRAWVFRAFVVLVFRAFLATWPRDARGHTIAQRLTYFVLLPLGALLLPVLPLRSHLSPPSAVISLCIGASALAFVCLLGYIGMDRFTYVKPPRELARSATEFLLLGIGYGLLIAVMTYGYCRYV